MASKGAPNPRALRAKLGLNQLDFWSGVGVTQSGGSRYESGRAMPKPVQILIGIAYQGKSLAAARRAVKAAEEAARA